jgi:hypothetical protein
MYMRVCVCARAYVCLFVSAGAAQKIAIVHEPQC